ncbi:hypothetical protein ACH0BG_10675 [Bacillus pumilus]|uniref:hypothetical protein n=1 Tax=Bacillus pumilus TaxID=1408 RepID=UPI0021B3FA07|nr:hypothetical protein [Bacillus pumilus]
MKKESIKAELVFYDFYGKGAHFRKEKELIHLGDGFAIGYEEGNGLALYKMAGAPGAWEIGDRDEVLFRIDDENEAIAGRSIEEIAQMSVVDFMVMASRRTVSH